ncbi:MULTISPECIES: glycosyltransferase family 4 protein [Paraburkholderia]|uniref:glycosyltransferase family 4 protein n=1 Tax=Paraburkholderia TaxID=1822464 RepID=UPI0006845390|nr:MULTISPECIES: glycosyltransferase family 4 protein [Paraburkholderia]MDH6147163.1 glycosyltransferase involved in cell wall biosynthesis [Paraburkholderia sp. WSM4179]
MRIAIVAPSPVPFVIGGAENLWWGLLDALNARPGIQADLLKVPSHERSMGELLASYRHFSQLDLNHFDLVISTKYPAWAIRHRNHVVYLQHTLRGLYDCYPPGMPTHFDQDALLSLGVPVRIIDALANCRPANIEFDDLLDALDAAWQRSPQAPCWTFPGPVTRAAIRLLDAVAMRPDKIVHYAAISQVVAARDGYFPPGVKVAVHHHPTSLKGLAPGPQQTLFSASRLDPAKRIDLIIEAYRQSNVDVPLHIAGSGPDEARLREAAAGHSGIRFLGRIPDAVLAQEYARAVCVPFVPRDEDYGLITLEAMLSAKPVITTTDSGGPLELIEHQRSGLVVEPDAAALAGAMRRVCGDLSAALDMGLAARARMAHLNWNTLCDALLTGCQQPAAGSPTAGSAKPAAPSVVARRAKPVLGVINTYPIAPVISGGKLRLHGLYSRVAEQFQVQFVNLAPSNLRGVRSLAADFSEELVPKSQAFAEAEQQLENTLGTSVEDLAAALHPTTAPQWLDAIDALARRADLMVCSHPYAMPALRKVSSRAFVYEAHNVEADLKADIYGSHRWAIDQVSALERRAVLDAALVTACSVRDRERMGELYVAAEDGAKLIVVPNGIDVAATPLRAAPQTQSRRSALRVAHPLALFMGSAHGPNIDAARLVIEAAARVPSVHFLLLGSVCHAVQAWERPANVGLVGIVSEAEKATWLAICDLGLNPVISGSGTNLKLLEYAAVGLPVVSTEFGARGLGYRAGQEYVSADADAFGDGIEAMLQLTQAERDCMVHNARRRVEAEGDWAAIAAAYSEALAQILA